MRKLLPILILLLSGLAANAQTWEIGAQIGGAGYMGDINPNNPIKISGLAAGAYVKRNIDGYFSVKLNYDNGLVTASDASSSSEQQRERNLSFSDRLSELALIGEFNFLKYIPDAGPNRWTPFIYAGIGVVGYNPTAVYQGTTYDLRPLTTEGESKQYGKTALTIPYGVGVKYNLTGKWTIMGDIGYRNPRTDYIDDVSGYYADPAKLPNDIARALADRSGEQTGIYTGSPGTQRGDLRPHDTYFFVQFTLSFAFVTQKCYFSN